LVDHVEVKGISGRCPTILLTRNEAHAAREQPRWRLAVVTRALDDPLLHIVDGPTALQNARPFMYQVDLA